MDVITGYGSDSGSEEEEEPEQEEQEAVPEAVAKSSRKIMFADDVSAALPLEQVVRHRALPPQPTTSATTRALTAPCPYSFILYGMLYVWAALHVCLQCPPLALRPTSPAARPATPSTAWLFGCATTGSD